MPQGNRLIPQWKKNNTARQQDNATRQKGSQQDGNAYGMNKVHSSFEVQLEYTTHHTDRTSLNSTLLVAGSDVQGLELAGKRRTGSLRLR